jgi:hypothetical protein
MPAIKPGWVAIFCRCRRLRRHVRHLPSLSPLVVGRRPVWSPPHRVGAPASRLPRVRVRARARAGRGARAETCTPARVRRSLEDKAGPLAPFSSLRRRSPPCLGRPRRRDPPWPCGMRARSPGGRNAAFSVALNTPPCTPTRSRHPTAGVVLAAAHGDEPGSAMHPCVPRLGLHLTHWGFPCTSATPRSAHGCSSLGRPHRHRVVAAAPAPAPNTPRTPSPLSCATRRVSTPRGVHGLPGGVQAPSAGEPRRRQGRIPPPPP